MFRVPDSQLFLGRHQGFGGNFHRNSSPQLCTSLQCRLRPVCSFEWLILKREIAKSLMLYFQVAWPMMIASLVHCLVDADILTYQLFPRSCGWMKQNEVSKMRWRDQQNSSRQLSQAQKWSLQSWPMTWYIPQQTQAPSRSKPGSFHLADLPTCPMVRSTLVYLSANLHTIFTTHTYIHT
jgi:hypothetical protein